MYVGPVLMSPLSRRFIHPLSSGSTFSVETSGHRHNVPMLREFIAKAPRLLGCEAAYYFPKGLDYCHVPEQGQKEIDKRSGGELDMEGVGEIDGSHEQDGMKGAGKLVTHIRSGDIFDNNVLSGYRQVKMCNNLLLLSFYGGNID